MAARHSITVILAAAVLVAMAVTLVVEARCLGAPAVEERYASLDGEVISRARRWADPDVVPVATCRRRRAASPEDDEAHAPRNRVHRHLKEDVEDKKEADVKKTADTKKNTSKTEGVVVGAAKPDATKEASEGKTVVSKLVAIKPVLITPAVVKPECSSEIKDSSSGSSETCDSDELVAMIESGPPVLPKEQDGKASYDMFGEEFRRDDDSAAKPGWVDLNKMLAGSLAEPEDYTLPDDMEATLASQEEEEDKNPTPETEVPEKTKDHVKKGSPEVGEKKATEAKPTKDKKETSKKTE